MSSWLAAFIWGCSSAVSLPLGAVAGLSLKPSEKTSSALMAFGAGALLFALTIELFGHALHVSHQLHDKSLIVATMVGAILGGLLFEALNQLINNKGGFLRKGALLKKHVEKAQRRDAKRMIRALSNVRMLQVLPASEIIQLIPKIEKERFDAGERIFTRGDKGTRLYFIVSGRVRVLRDDEGDTKTIAELGVGDTFGEIALVSDQTRTATVQAVDAVEAWTIRGSDFAALLERSPQLQQACEKMVATRLHEMQRRDLSSEEEAEQWARQARKHFRKLALPLTETDYLRQIEKHSGHGAALAIWLGIALDAIPESLVIGLLVVASATAGEPMKLAFIAGVFLANLPESMSSAITMRRGGSSLSKVFWMWMSLCLMTGLGAAIGALIFPANPSGTTLLLIMAIEGLSAGAMLTMIAETMLPEAFEHGGGTIVGLSTLVGFLASLGVKLGGS